MNEPYGTVDAVSSPEHRLERNERERNGACSGEERRGAEHHTRVDGWMDGWMDGWSIDNNLSLSPLLLLSFLFFCSSRIGSCSVVLNLLELERESNVVRSHRSNQIVCTVQCSSEGLTGRKGQTGRNGQTKVAIERDRAEPSGRVTTSIHLLHCITSITLVRTPIRRQGQAGRATRRGAGGAGYDTRKRSGTGRYMTGRDRPGTARALPQNRHSTDANAGETRRDEKRRRSTDLCGYRSTASPAVTSTQSPAPSVTANCAAAAVLYSQTR